MSNRFTGLIYIAFALCTIACSIKKQQPVTRHANANTPLISTSESSLSDKKLFRDIDTEAKALLNSKWILSEAWVNDSRLYFRKLNQLNESLILMWKQKNPQAGSYIEMYRTALMADCEYPLLKNCRTLPYFMGASDSVFFTKLFALNAKGVEEAYFWTKMSFELNHNQPDQELAGILFKQSIALLQSYTSIQDNSISLTEPKSTEFFLQSMRLLWSSLLNYDAKKIASQYPDVIAEWLKVINYSGAENLFGVKFVNYLRELGSYFFDIPKVRQWFLEQATKNLNQTDGLSTSPATGIRAALDALELQNPGLVQRLGIQVPNTVITSQSIEDFLNLYVVNQLYALEKERTILPYWQKSNQNFSLFAKNIKSIITIQMAQNAVITNKRMADKIREFIAAGKPKNEILDELVKFARSDLNQLWIKYFDRVRHMRSFFENTVGPTYLLSASPEEKLAYNDLGSFFNNLNTLVKEMVIYPNLMMFAYYATIWDFTQTFEFMQIKVTIDKDVVTNDLFNGRLPPIFNFFDTSDPKDTKAYKKLDSLQMIWALHYAINMNLWQYYDVDVKKWIEVLFDQAIQRHRENLKKWTDTLHNFTLKESGYFETKRICEAAHQVILTNQSTQTKIPIDVDLTHFYTRVLFGTPSSTNAAFSKLTGPTNFILGSIKDKNPLTIDEVLEFIRTDIDPRLQKLELIKNVFLRSPDGEQKQQALDTIDSILTNYTDLRNSIQLQAREYFQFSVSCLMDTSELELERRRDVFQMLVQLQTDVFYSIDLLNKSAQQKFKTVGEALDQWREHPIWQREGFHQLTLDTRWRSSNLLTSLNQIIKDKLHLQFIFKFNPEYLADYDQSAGIKQAADGTHYWRLRNTEVLLAVAHLSTYGYGSIHSRRPFEQFNISYPGNLINLVKATEGLNGVIFEPVNFSISTNNDISLSDRLQVFVTSISRLLADEVNSIGGFFSTSILLRNILRAEASVHKFIPYQNVSLLDNFSCDQNCQKKLNQELNESSLSLVNQTIRMLKMLNLNVTDDSILNFTQYNDFFSFNRVDTLRNGPEYLFTEFESYQKTIGLTDELYTDIVSIRLGYDALFRRIRPYAESFWTVNKTESIRANAEIKPDDLMPRPDPYSEAETVYASILMHDEEQLLPIDPKLVELAFYYHRHSIFADQLVFNDFHKLLETFDRSQIPPMYFSKIIPKDEKPALLTPLLRSSVEEQLIEFHRKTKGVYKLPSE